MLKSISVLSVLELQEQICRSWYDAIDLTELLLVPDLLHILVRTPKARGHYIRNPP